MQGSNWELLGTCPGEDGFSEMLQFGEGRLLLLKVHNLRYIFDITEDQLNQHSFQQRPEILCKECFFTWMEVTRMEVTTSEVIVNPPLHNLYPLFQNK